MCGNNGAGGIEAILRHNLSEQRFRRNVQPVTRFVHQQQVHVGGESKSDGGFFRLSMRKFIHFLIPIHAKLVENGIEFIMIELGIERRIQLGKLFCR